MQQNFTLIITALILIPILLFFYWRLRLKKLVIYKSPILGKIEVFEIVENEKVGKGKHEEFHKMLDKLQKIYLCKE